MSKIQKYIISYDWDVDVEVEIDLDLITDSDLYEINNFWADAKSRLLDADGDVLKAVLTLLAQRAIIMSVDGTDVVKVFQTDPPEGWPKLDGSCGIKLVNCDQLCLDLEDFTVTKR